MKGNELKVGMYLWWSCEDEQWECPCIVTYIGPKTFSLLVLDDFREEGDYPLDDSEGPYLEYELDPCPPEKAEKYLQEKRDRLWYKFARAKATCDKIQPRLRKIDNFLKQIRDAIPAQKPTLRLKSKKRPGRIQADRNQ